LFLHHHSIAYAVRTRPLARWLFALAGADVTHVTICERAAALLSERYPAVRRIRVLSNAFLVAPPTTAWRESGPVLRIGHLSNLSRAKGLDLVLETVASAVRAGIACTLDLAGELTDPDGRDLIDRYRQQHPLVVRHHGPLYDDAKYRFFEDLDVFLFPSRLSEIQGIVNLEAMRCAAVPIAYGHGCIPSDFAEGGGIALEVGSDFVGGVLPSLVRWSRSPHLLSEARRLARARFEVLHHRSVAQVDQLIGELCRVPGREH
jgi:glycosyltransferase involved in cell wall biosynthesis